MPRIPGVNHQVAVRALQKAGFRIARQGNHIAMNPVNAFTGFEVSTTGDIDDVRAGRYAR